MSLYAIGDLHLHYQSVLKAPGQLHDRVWKNHEEKFRKNCQKLITDEDTLVLVGDHSWGKTGQTVIGNTSCSCTTHRPVFWRNGAALPIWRRNTVRSRWFMRIATERAGSTTAFMESTEDETIIWYPGIICGGNR